MTRQSLAATLSLTIGLIGFTASPAWANQGKTINFCTSTTEPKPNEVLLYGYSYFAATSDHPCQVLYFDSAARTVPNHGNCDPSKGCINFDTWTCFDTTTSGLLNDAALSVKVGSEARVFLFRNSFNEKENGAPLILGPNARIEDLSWYDFGSNISAARVVDATKYDDKCTQNVGYGLVLYSDANQQGDCVILNNGSTYNTPLSMCFHNDSASSYYNWGPQRDRCYEHANLGGREFGMYPGFGNLDPFFVQNDIISSCTLLR
jgi:hypothetical protein